MRKTLSGVGRGRERIGYETVGRGCASHSLANSPFGGGQRERASIPPEHNLLPTAIHSRTRAQVYLTLVRAMIFAASALLTGALAGVVLSLEPAPQPSWKITHRVSAHHALVVEVESRHPEDALAIARAIGEPERGRFGEILVFVNRPGRRDILRRVQWTPKHGYIETVYQPEGRRQ